MEVNTTETQTYKKKKIVRNAAIVFITIVVLLTFFSKTINNFLLPEVECGSPTAGILKRNITTQGEIVPLNTESINAVGNWKVTDIKVKDGATVKKGQILATIDLSNVKLDIKRMELNLFKMKNALKLYQNGTQVIDVEQYKDDVQLAQSAVKKAEKKLAEQKNLFSCDAVPLESVNDAQEQLDAAKREYEQKLKLLNQKQDQNKKGDENYQTTLKEKQAEIEVCKLELESMKKNSPQDGIIKSPVAGVIKSISIEKGSVTNSGQQMFEIIKNESDFYVKWTLNSMQADAVNEKSSIRFFTAEPEKLELSGTIKDKKLTSEGLYEYIARIAKQKDEIVNLQIGQQLDVLIQNSSIPYLMLVPNSSITNEAGKSCVYVIKTKKGILGEENYAQKVEIIVNEADDFYSAITGSIAGDDRVVSFSSKPLYDKIQVKLR